MHFVPSWKALFAQGAAQQPELKDFRGYAELLQHGDGTSLPACVWLTFRRRPMLPCSCMLATTR
jgi:hypothetical protein